MKGLFKSKPRTPVDVARQTRDLLIFADLHGDARESKREEKVRLVLISSSSSSFSCMKLSVAQISLFHGCNDWNWTGSWKKLELVLFGW